MFCVRRDLLRDQKEGTEKTKKREKEFKSRDLAQLTGAGVYLDS